VTEVAFAFMAARSTLGLAPLWARIDALDGKVPGDVQLVLYERVRHGLIAAAADFLREGIAAGPLAETIRLCGTSCAAIAAMLDDIAPRDLAERLARDSGNLTERGVPPDLARDVVRLAVLVDTPAIVATAERGGAAIRDTARAYLELARYLRVDEIAARAQELSPADDYERLAIGGGLASLGDAHRRLTAAFLRTAADRDLQVWFKACGPLAETAHRDLDAIATAPEMSVARLAVASARLAGLAQAMELSAAH